MSQILTLLKISRPAFWFSTIISFYLGTITANIHWDGFTLIGLFFVTFPLCLILFGFNDVADRKTDALNPRKGSWQGYRLKENQIPMVIVSTAATILLSVTVFLLISKPLSAMLILIMSLLAILYSFPPVRLKAKPFLDSLANSLGMVLVFIFGLTFKSQYFNLADIPQVVWVLTIGCSAIIALAQLADFEVDKKGEDLTTAVFLGKKWTAFYAAALFTVAGLVLNKFQPAVFIYLFLAVTIGLYLTFRPNHKVTVFATWYTIIGFQLLVFWLLIFDQPFIYQLLRL